MHRMSVAWIAALLPVLAGCGAVRNLTTQSHLDHAQRGIEGDLRKEAHAAWHGVRSQHSRRAFTAEFHDGFLDGYVDYLDRGGAAQPPAVPPLKYVRDRKYFTPEGHCLINDYYLGFKYGADVAVASGRRKYLTVPVLLADPNCPAEVHAVPTPPEVPYVVVPPKPKSDDPLPPPRPLPEPPKGNKFGNPNPGVPELPPPPGFGPKSSVPPLPKPEVPVIKPFNPDLTGGNKFGPLPATDPDLLPAPYPALPIPEPGFDPLPVPVPADGPLPLPVPVPLSSLKVAVPAPPDTVPVLPAGVPTPRTHDAVPVVPFRHSPPPGAGVGTIPWKK